MRRAPVAVAVAALTLVGACGKAGDTGLQVKGYAANLVFSDTPRPPLVPAGDRPGPVTADQVGDVQLPKAVFDSSRLTPPSRAVQLCPAAPLGAGALEQATPVVGKSDRPETGRYRWKRAGTQTVTAAGNAKLNIAGFEPRVVRDVREINDSDFAYQTVSPDLTGQTTYVTTWQVKPEALQERESQLGLAVAAGDPERGLTIKAIDNFDAANKMTGSFRPTTGLLVLPLPVVPGEQFVSVAVDPQTLQAAQYQAQVVSRERIDACGDYVEGWLVKGTLTFSGGQPEQYDILVATQFGALVVTEHRAGQNLAGPFDVTVSLGQLHPFQ